MNVDLTKDLYQIACCCMEDDVTDPEDPIGAESTKTKKSVLAEVGVFCTTLKGFLISASAVIAALATLFASGCQLPLISELCTSPSAEKTSHNRQFKPTPPKNSIERSSEYEGILVSVFYRKHRLEDAQKTAGALAQAGFKTTHAEVGLDNAVVPNKSSGFVWIKATPAKVGLKEKVRWIISGELVPGIPGDKLGLAPGDLNDDLNLIERRGDIQVQLY